MSHIKNTFNPMVLTKVNLHLIISEGRAIESGNRDLTQDHEESVNLETEEGSVDTVKKELNGEIHHQCFSKNFIIPFLISFMSQWLLVNHI